jgi:hypothetical protein
MEVGKPVALGLTTLSLAGAEERAIALFHAGEAPGDSVHDAGAARGTLLFEQEQRGYVALGWRQPIELRHPYRGGSLSDYLT